MSAELGAEALIGDEADAFMRSDLGRMLVGMAEQEGMAALDELKSVKITETDRIQELQNIVWRSEKFAGWLRELVSRGEQAIQTLQHEEADHE